MICYLSRIPILLKNTVYDNNPGNVTFIEIHKIKFEDELCIHNIISYVFDFKESFINEYGQQTWKLLYTTIFKLTIK